MKTRDRNPVNRPLRILVAEDNRDDRDLLVRQLRASNSEGHVKIIRDGRPAWNFLAAEGSDTSLIAVFLDLNLPSLSCVKLLCRIKSHPRLRDIPVIVMTSSNASEELGECTRLGADDYMAKPVTMDAFTKAVADLFQHAPAGVLARSE